MRGPVCILFVLIKIATTIEIRNILPLASKVAYKLADATYVTATAVNIILYNLILEGQD